VLSRTGVTSTEIAIMTPLNDTQFLVLFAAHLNKMAGPEAIAAATELDRKSVDAVLEQASEAGFGASMGAQFMIFPDGSTAVLEYCNSHYAELRSEELQAWYERFETLNTQFIKLITEWQTTSGDKDVEGKILKVVERLIRAIEKLLPDVPRYAHYVRRFNAGIARVDAGDASFVVTPTKDSIHNVWFEFHEDILSVLGRPRDTA
jgi:hypothetical protein